MPLTAAFVPTSLDARTRSALTASGDDGNPSRTGREQMSRTDQLRQSIDDLNAHDFASASEGFAPM
jgi:hypothetical protein